MEKPSRMMLDTIESCCVAYYHGRTFGNDEVAREEIETLGLSWSFESKMAYEMGVTHYVEFDSDEPYDIAEDLKLSKRAS